ncbi:MAG: DUF2460 domain-containing protein [Thermodesulfobacteriota bacterium]
MAKFPEITDLPIEEPYSEELEFKTLATEFEGLGAELRKQKRLYPRRNISVQCSRVTKVEGRTLWAFYLARAGAKDSFNFFLPHTDLYTGEYVGTGDGSITVFNLPSKGATSYTVYRNGAAQIGGGVDYTFGAGTGEDGADKITFTVAPNDGDRITFDFTGYLKVRCRFMEDKLSFELLMNQFVTSGVKLKGLLNDQ